MRLMVTYIDLDSLEQKNVIRTDSTPCLWPDLRYTVSHDLCVNTSVYYTSSIPG